MGEFNEEFDKTVECCVFKEIGPEEMAAWDGQVNYISMMEAFKEGPLLHNTTKDMHEQQSEATQAGVAVPQ